MWHISCYESFAGMIQRIKFIALFLIVFTTKLWAIPHIPDRELITVQKGIKYAVQMMSHNEEVVTLKRALENQDVKRIFTLLFDVSADKLPLFIDEDIFEYSIEALRKEFIIPLDRQRLEMIARLLRYGRRHALLPSLFRNYRCATRRLIRGEGGVSVSYAMGKHLETKKEAFLDIFQTVQKYLETHELFYDPVQSIMQSSAQHGSPLIPTADIVEWHTKIREIDPAFFSIEGEGAQAFFHYSAAVRRSFTNPHALFQYLTTLSPIERTDLAEEYINTYKEKFKEGAPTTLAPSEWAKLYVFLRKVDPESIAGIFSLPENRIYVEYFSVPDHPYKNHIVYLRTLMAQGNEAAPAELILVLKYIAKTRNYIPKTELQNLTAALFLQWLQEGKLPEFERQMLELKGVRAELLELQNQFLNRERAEMEYGAIEEAERIIDRNVEVLERIFGDMSIDRPRTLLLAEYASASEDLTLAADLLGRIYGEGYLVKFKALRTYVRQLKAAILK